MVLGVPDYIPGQAQPLEARRAGILDVELWSLYQSRGRLVTLVTDIRDQRDLRA